MQYQSKEKLFYVTFFLTISLVGSTCAPYQVYSAREGRPMVASMEIVAPMEEPTPPDPQEESNALEEETAGVLLERGFLAFHGNRHRRAADSFSAAIVTGNLNDAGRALAYWHIAESERRLGNEDQSAEALTSFALVAQDVLDIRDQRRYAVDKDGDFVEHFRLATRIAEARGYVAAIWAKRAKDFGRTPNNPITALNPEEGDFFVEFASPCAGSNQVKRESLPTSTVGVRLERITITCPKEDQTEQYYLIFPTVNFE